MERFALKCVGYADGSSCPMSGKFVQQYDHNANDGLGQGKFTPDFKKALTFLSRHEAFRFWRQVPHRYPFTDKGMANRPLTVLLLEIVSDHSKSEKEMPGGGRLFDIQGGGC